MAEQAPHSVAMFLYDGVAASDVTGPLECFDLANYISGRRLYSIATFSERGKAVKPAGSWVSLKPLHGFETLPSTVDTLLLPGGPTSFTIAADPKLKKWLKSRARKTGRICSICTGAFILAAAGLARQQRVTTHWYYAEQLAQAYSDIHVEPDALYIHSGKIWSSGGMTAGMDLALAVIESDFGRPLAMEVARFMVLYLRRSASEPQFSMLLKSQFQNIPQMDRIRQWIMDEPDGDLRIPVLSKRSGVAVRTLLRQFKKAAGISLGEFIINARLRRACSLLEQAHGELKVAAKQSGLGTQANLRKTFLRRFGISPSEYRKRFRLQEELPSVGPKLHLAYDEMWIDRADVKARRAELRKT